jgi:hypothetical protein
MSQSLPTLLVKVSTSTWLALALRTNIKLGCFGKTRPPGAYLRSTFQLAVEAIIHATRPNHRGPEEQIGLLIDQLGRHLNCLHPLWQP